MVQNVGQLERRRGGNCTQLKCACCGGQEKKTRLDHVRNVDIWKEAHMYPMAEFLREKRLRWFGQVQRRYRYDATRKIFQMTVDGKRNRGRPKLVKDDTARNQMTTEMAEDRRHWHVMIRARTLRSVEADR